MWMQKNETVIRSKSWGVLEWDDCPLGNDSVPVQNHSGLNRKGGQTALEAGKPARRKSRLNDSGEW